MISLPEVLLAIDDKENRSKQIEAFVRTYRRLPSYIDLEVVEDPWKEESWHDPRFGTLVAMRL